MSTVVGEGVLTAEGEGVLPWQASAMASRTAVSGAQADSKNLRC